MRLVVINAFVQLVHLGAGNIGRVGNQNIELPHVAGRTQTHIRAERHKTALHAQPARIFARDTQRALGIIDRDDARVLHMVRGGNADAARTAAQVENTGRYLLFGLRDHHFAQRLGVRARDEHVFIHLKGQAVKIPLAQ